MAKPWPSLSFVPLRPASVLAKKWKSARARAWRCCPASSPIAKAATPSSMSCSWWRATARGAAPRWGVTRKPRPCCPCEARCSTLGKSIAICCSKTPRCTTWPWPLASIPTAPTTTPTCRACAMARCAFCRTPMSTAHTFRCCCSPCFSATSPSSSKRVMCMWPARRCSGWMCPHAAKNRRPNATPWTKASCKPFWITAKKMA